MDAKTLQKAAGISPPRAAVWAEPLTHAMAEFGIDTPVRQAAFIAQCAHESAGFAYIREVWGPTAAQLGYEGRADLGNTQKGDGSRYRGRGLIQITGRANYAAAGQALGVDLIRNPQLLEGTELAARSAAWFWKEKGLNAMADAGDFLALSIRINGKNKKTGLPNGWEDRLARYESAKLAMGVQ